MQMQKAAFWEALNSQSLQQDPQKTLGVRKLLTRSFHKLEDQKQY